MKEVYKDKYYGRNREAIKAKRKRQYDTDAEFRKEHKKRVAAYKKRKAAERKLQKQQIKLERKVWSKVRVGDAVVDCCKITFLASALGRKSKTIRLWESERGFPKTFSIRNIRYYTRNHFNMITMMWDRTGKGDNLNEFIAKVKANWNNQY